MKCPKGCGKKKGEGARGKKDRLKGKEKTKKKKKTNVLVKTNKNNQYNQAQQKNRRGGGVVNGQARGKKIKKGGMNVSKGEKNQKKIGGVTGQNGKGWVENKNAQGQW